MYWPADDAAPALLRELGPIGIAHASGAQEKKTERDGHAHRAALAYTS